MPAPIPLTLSASTVTFSSVGFPPISVEAAVSAGHSTTFPVAWSAVSADPMIQIQVTNNSVTAPIAPILVDTVTEPIQNVTRRPILAELTTVMPGQTINELVAALPVSQMILVLFHTWAETPDTVNGFTVNIAAWKL